jgi:hypothetical protein
VGGCRASGAGGLDIAFGFEGPVGCRNAPLAALPHDEGVWGITPGYWVQRQDPQITGAGQAQDTSRVGSKSVVKLFVAATAAGWVTGCQGTGTGHQKPME